MTLPLKDEIRAVMIALVKAATPNHVIDAPEDAVDLILERFDVTPRADNVYFSNYKEMLTRENNARGV